MKKLLKTILIIFCALLLIVAAYVAYVFIDYHRIGDMTLEVSNENTNTVAADGEYKLLSYNIGFGAYESDYSFFMDGGTESWAWSKERLLANMDNICGVMNDADADFIFVQEVDINSTRSYHVNEEDILTENVGSGDSYTFAQNYDSPFLFYPITQPHGKSQSGLLTFSSANITSAERVELPIEDSVKKMIDLDRCYSVNRVSVDNGKELVLYNIHLSAYTSDGTIAIDQLNLLVADMESEYEKGNYVVCAGDFNKDVLGNSPEYFHTEDSDYTWAQPIPEGTFSNTHLTLIGPVDESNPVPSCRNADSAYHEGQYVVTVDGFIVSDNVESVEATVIDTQFAYSDHNPVELTFKLK